MTLEEIREKYIADLAIISRRTGNFTGVAEKYQTEANVRKSDERASAKFGSEHAWFKNTEGQLVAALKGLQGLVTSGDYANENASYTSSSALKSAVRAASDSLKATIVKYRRAIKLAQMGFNRTK